MISLPMSWWIQHSKPAQIRQHLSNGCQSNRQDLVKHQRPVSPQKQHHRGVSCIVLVAKKCESLNFRTISPGTMHWPTVVHSVVNIQKSVRKNHTEMIQSIKFD